jgi:putative Mg2+ transporter-C (MgtC) family protein
LDDPLFLLKILTVFLMALFFGLERQLEHKPVGFGVYSFVGCASCALTIVALNHAPGTAMPLLGAVVTGVGFLGAGALLRQSDHISGLISAASLWTFAILGIVVGYGEFVVAAVLYVAIWLILGVNRLFEFQSFGFYRKTLVLRARRYLTKEDLKSTFGIRGLVGYTSQFDKEKSEFRCSATLSGRPDELNALPPRLLADADILEFSIQ